MKVCVEVYETESTVNDRFGDGLVPIVTETIPGDGVALGEPNTSTKASGFDPSVNIDAGSGMASASRAAKCPPSVFPDWSDPTGRLIKPVRSPVSSVNPLSSGIL
jgi:hypothetical protein